MHILIIQRVKIPLSIDYCDLLLKTTVKEEILFYPTLRLIFRNDEYKDY